MAFTYTNSRGQTYILHSKDVILKNGLERTIYYFAKEAKGNLLSEVPSGYEITETDNGLPVLKGMENVRHGRFSHSGSARRGEKPGTRTSRRLPGDPTTPPPPPKSKR